MHTVRLDDGLFRTERTQRAARSSRRSCRGCGRPRWGSGSARPARTSRGPRWACRTCSSTWSSRAPSGAARGRSRSRSRSGAASLDAYTSRDHTTYQAHVLDERPAAGGRRPDRPGPPAAAARRATSRSSGTWCSRRSAMVEDTPDDLVFELHSETLWPAHPYGYSHPRHARDGGRAVGRRPPGARTGAGYYPRQLRGRGRGHVDHEQLLDAAGAGWVVRGAGARARRCRRSAPGRRGARRGRREARDTAQAHIVFGHRHVSATRDPGATRWPSLTNVFGGGMSSRLFQRVREELGLAYAVYAFHQFYQLGGAGRGVRRHPAGHRGPGARRDPRGVPARWSRDGLPADELDDGQAAAQGPDDAVAREPGEPDVPAGARSALYGEPLPPARRGAGARSTRSRRDRSRRWPREFFAPERQTVVRAGAGDS